MADEIRVQMSLYVLKGNLEYQSRPTMFLADMAGTKGAGPGVHTITQTGTDIDLSKMSTPGLCWIQNLEDAASSSVYVEYGIWDTETGNFFPLAEVLPGEMYLIRLSRNLGVQYDLTGTGTGTTAATNRFRLKSRGGSAIVRIDSFDA